MIETQIQVDGGRVTERLDEFIRAGQNTAPLMQSLGNTLVNRVRMGFRQGRDPYGLPWAPLKFRSGQPLRDTRRLMRSITFASDRESVTVGTNTCYAIVHQFGATVTAHGEAGRTSLCDYVTVGSPVLRFHAEGGEWIHAKSVTIPKRRFFPEDRLPHAWEPPLLRDIERHFGGG